MRGVVAWVTLDDAGDHPLEPGVSSRPNFPSFMSTSCTISAIARVPRPVPTRSAEQRFERAAVALVRVITVELSKADRPFTRIAKHESCFRIDEALDQHALAMRSTCTSGA